MRRSLVPKLGLITAGLILSLVLLEIVARAFHLGSGGFWEPHRLYGWRNIPNASGWESCYGECAVHVEINSLGLRGVETTYRNEIGLNRILVLGDSMTAAMQVPLEDTFASVLERRLNDGRGENEWEVINGGVNAFGTDNELIFFRVEGRKYAPDLVVLAVYLANDVYNNSRTLETQLGGSEHKPYFELSEDGGLVLRNFPVESTDTFPIRVGSYLKKHFQLPRFAAQILALRSRVPTLLAPIVELLGGGRGVQETGGIRNQSSLSNDICSEKYSAEIEEAWEITKALVQQLRLEANESGAEFAVILLPASRQIAIPRDGESWYCDKANEELASFLEVEAIPHLDLLPAFRKHALTSEEPLYFERDFHMNSTGHGFAGDLISEFLVRELIEG